MCGGEGGGGGSTMFLQRHFCFEQGSWDHHEPEGVISHTYKMGRVHGTYYTLSIIFGVLCTSYIKFDNCIL